jgi:cell shape-determining protein MreC
VSKKFTFLLGKLLLLIIFIGFFIIINLEPIQSKIYNFGYHIFALQEGIIKKFTKSDTCNKVNLELEISRLQRENNLLREEINLPKIRKNKYLSATISQITQFRGEEAFIINIGIEEGVKVGDFIMKGKTLLGRIVEVGKVSIVAPLGSNAIKIPALVIPSNQNCIVGKNLSQGEDLELAISYLQGSKGIKEGDLVISSWQDNLPAGIEIGYIIKIDGKFLVKSPRVIVNSQIVQVLISD